MEKWRVMLCAGNREVYIKRAIFHGDSLSPLVFVLALIPLGLILRKTKAVYEFSGSKEKISNILFMDDLKLYSCNEKELNSLVQTIHIFSRYRNRNRNGVGIKKCAMLVIGKGKIVKSVSKYR